MAHGVLIPEQIAAINIDSLNRSVFTSSASAIDNGFVFTCTTKVNTSGSGAEVFNIATPSSGSLGGLWMAYSGDEIVVTESKYKGLDPDPRNFYNATSKVFSAYRPQVGDIILLTGAAIDGTVNSYAVATASTYMLTWGANSIDGLSYKLLGTKYISIGTGAIDSQRVTAYELECVHI
jgi:hypothetical protein